LLGRAAEIWETFRTRSLTDAIAMLDAPYLEELRRDGSSPLAGTLAGILLLKGRRHDLLGDWLADLAARLPDWADGPVLAVEHQLQQGWDDEALLEATNRLLLLEGRDLPCTADCLGLALRQVADLLTYGRQDGDSRRRLEKLRDRLRDALQFYGRAVLFSAFTARGDELRPELVRALTFPRFIKERFPSAADSVRAVINRVDWRLEPAVFGAAEPDPSPGGIHATLLGSTAEVSWLADRPNTGTPVAVRWLAGDEPTDTASAVEARPDGARWRLIIRPGHLDERWRGFYLTRTDGPLEADPDRELVYLRHSPVLPGAPDPVRLVASGFLAEGWSRAVEAGMTEAELLGLLGLVWPQMRLLLEGISAPNPRVEEDLTRCVTEVDARQQGVRERWQEGLERGEFAPGAAPRPAAPVS
jgi:hypothetical protein